jgi:hypothetical protein
MSIDPLTGRNDKNMQDTTVQPISETQPLNIPAVQTKMSSSFNEAEYQRWAEKLRNRNRPQGK